MKDDAVIIVGDPHFGRPDPFYRRPMPTIIAFEISDVAPMRGPPRIVPDRSKDWEKGQKRRMKPRKR